MPQYPRQAQRAYFFVSAGCFPTTRGKDWRLTAAHCRRCTCWVFWRSIAWRGTFSQIWVLVLYLTPALRADEARANADIAEAVKEREHENRVRGKD